MDEEYVAALQAAGAEHLDTIVGALQSHGFTDTETAETLKAISSISDIEIDKFKHEFRDFVFKTQHDVDDEEMTPMMGFARLAIRLKIPHDRHLSKEELLLIRFWGRRHSTRQIAKVFERSLDTIHRALKARIPPDPPDPEEEWDDGANQEDEGGADPDCIEPTLGKRTNA